MLFCANFFTVYILPPLVFAVIAAAIAFFLSFLGNKLKVERDERIDEVRAKLSGANCGGCGYAGCDAFAEALVKGEATLDGCHSTPDEERAGIAEILGVKAEKLEPTVAVVKCAGGAACSDVCSYVGKNDCAAKIEICGGSKSCSFGCLGSGSCAAACPYGAIAVKDGLASVDYPLCRSCGACVAVCPKGLIERVPISAKVYVACSSKCKGKEVISACKNGCIGCGKCERLCVAGAIKTIDNLPVIDYSKCVGCYACADGCPRGSIKRFR